MSSNIILKHDFAVFFNVYPVIFYFCWVNRFCIMKKLLLKTFIVFSFLLSSAIAKAQWVTIPDANFVTFLNTYYSTCMNGNLMDTTCSAITNLTYLNCNNEIIYDITGIEYFDSLKVLSCQSNHLSFLPNLPTTLLNLACGYGNLLTSLPSLPSSLTYIECHQNLLTLLPPLPSGLQYLDCSINQLTTLPTLPVGVHYLNCSNNQLTVLPSLAPALQSLYCYNNYLTSLPTLPPMLEDLYCANNQINLIPNFPLTLTLIICDNNQLVSLPDLPDSVDFFWINNNSALTCFPKYKRIDDLKWYNTAITCFPSAGYIGTAVPSLNYIPLCFPFSGCNFNWNIYGRAFNELNINCTKDSNELFVKNIPVELDSGGIILQQFVFNSGGYYSFQTGLGNYEVKIDTIGLPFDVLCPSGGIQFSSLTAIDSLDANLDFGLQCKPSYLDLEAKSTAPSGRLSPGRIRTLYLRAGDATLFYGITCATGISGTVEAVLSNLVSYVAPYGSALMPSINGDTLTWNISDFSTVDPLTAFNVIVQVDSNATIGDTACFQLNIYPFADSNPANNSLVHCFPIVNSVDPNVKEIYPGGLVDTTQHDFTFTIYFQNTGTAAADNIYILDTLDNDLDAATFQFLSSSHDPVTQLLPGNILRFSFPHINLADSTSNEQQSHGYVQFKVRRKSIYYSGMSITNRAFIYFDFNPAVATNEAIAWFDNNLGITVAPQVAFAVYPNPARDIINIETYSQDNTALQIELFDITGRKLKTVFNGKSTTGVSNYSLSVKGFSKGVYVLKLNDGVKKVVVE
jgi:hypothetical protein